MNNPIACLPSPAPEQLAFFCADLALDWTVISSFIDYYDSFNIYTSSH